jgi:hypothetical protein
MGPDAIMPRRVFQMRKLIILTMLAASVLGAGECFARGGFSSTSVRSTGFNSSRSYSIPSRSYSKPSNSYTSSSRSTSTSPSISKVTTTRTTTSRTAGGSYYGGHSYHPAMYPGFGAGYSYSNGMLTGLIIGNMMHPHGTTVYTGGGYNGSALLYPDGRVVDQNGYQVGTYADGRFTPQAGGLVAQPAPSDFTPKPVVVEQRVSGWDIAGGIIVAVLAIIIIAAIFA